MSRITVAVAVSLFPISLGAQWLNFKTPGIPRTADGKPNLTAPAPRTADGKPELSGLWASAPNTYWFDVIQDIKDESIFKPAAEAVFQKRSAAYSHDWPGTHCLPVGPGVIFHGMYRIIQSPTVVALLFNSDVGAGDDYRQIFLDGREPPKDPNPTWRGYSVGHWEGDTLVVETAGFNDRSWLDWAGHPHSENLHVTERFHRVDFGHMDLQIAFDDPETFTKPLTISLPANYQADTEMLESVCDDERDASHLVGKVKQTVQLTTATLEKYTGTYELTAGPLPRLTFRFTVAGGHLYFGALPLIPQSETGFESLAGYFEFAVDASGGVTGVTYSIAEGEFRAVRKP